MKGFAASIPEQDRTREKERERILASFKVFDVPAIEQAEILEALDSKEWDWFTDCDGCTCVSEEYWPSAYFPPCLRHDFDWKTRRPVHAANARFYRLQKTYGIPPFWAGVRYAGVYLGWYGFFKWKHLWEDRRLAAEAVRFTLRNPAFVLGAPRRAAATLGAMRRFAREHGGKCRVTGMPHAEVCHIESVAERPDLAADPKNMVMLIRPIHRALFHPMGWRMSIGRGALPALVHLCNEVDAWKADTQKEEPADVPSVSR